jgi:hypothetical protein
VLLPLLAIFAQPPPPKSAHVDGDAAARAFVASCDGPLHPEYQVILRVVTVRVEK